MPIETICPGCSRKLRVSDEHAGRQARCPACNTIYTVAGRDQMAAADAADQQWQMRTPEGQTYGPVGKRELDKWVSEGRVTADCQLSSGDGGPWQSAAAVYAVLNEAPASRMTSSPSGGANQNPPDAAGQNRDRRYRYIAAHRGGLILALGIISWVIGCPIFGIFAWVMGSADMREMRLGRMDPSGMGLTQAGQVIGMIHGLVFIILCVVLVFVILASIAAR